MFSIIPALKNAEFLRYGVMHKNIFINAPKILNADFSVKGKKGIYFAGQITGVEGYVESAASGLLVGINVKRLIDGKPPVKLDKKTVLGSLAIFIATPNENFQPMNANYGIMEVLPQVTRDKAVKKQLIAERSLKIITEIKENLD